MKADETPSKEAISRKVHRRPTFAKVCDGRKQPIRGLWKRGRRCYARLNAANPITGRTKTRRIRLVDKDAKAVQRVPQTMVELNPLQTHRLDDKLPVLERTPKFSDYAQRYLDFISSGRETKKRVASASVREGIFGGRHAGVRHEHT